MRFALNEDQTTFFGVLDQMLAEAAFHPTADWGRYDYGAGLDAQLAEAGFYDVGQEADLGIVSAALMVHRAAQVPQCFDCAGPALIHPKLGADVPRALTVRVDGARGPLRYAPQAGAILRLTRQGAAWALLPEGAVTPVAGLFAYPMGQVDETGLDWQEYETNAGELRRLWQIGLAAELTGVLQAGLNAVLEHVRTREQFGRPLGAFQAVQHRLAHAAVEIEGAVLLMLRAADTQAEGDVALALSQAQAIATRISNDLHQFMGAMGLTLEHPLHRWTYRSKALRSEMGGAGAAQLAYATARWGQG